MIRIHFACVHFLLFLFACIHSGNTQEVTISIVEKKTDHKVDILFNGSLFTSYCYTDTIEKPFLYPVYSAKGTIVTRGFPFNPQAGERVDHPHHFGIWFNYGNVNGIDFWNNSYAILPEKKINYGFVKHQEIVKIQSGRNTATLVVKANWVNAEYNVLLNEETTFEFSGNVTTRRIDRITKLTAVAEKLIFSDDKEGLLGFRVARAFEDSMEKPEILIGLNGKPNQVPIIDNTGVNGIYRNSNGQERIDAWGKRARWVKLSAMKDNERITIAMFDHSGNFGYPAMWHARGYGLFAVNNFGGKAFDKNEQPLSLVLNSGESVTFRHRIVITSGLIPSDNDMDREFKAFINLKQ